MLNKLNMFRKTNQMIDLTIVVEVSDLKYPHFGSKYPQKLQKLLIKFDWNLSSQFWASNGLILGLETSFTYHKYLCQDIREIFMVYKSNIFMGI